MSRYCDIQLFINFIKMFLEKLCSYKLMIVKVYCGNPKTRRYRRKDEYVVTTLMQVFLFGYLSYAVACSLITRRQITV